jgi:hypothetical protein
MHGSLLLLYKEHANIPPTIKNLNYFKYMYIFKYLPGCTVAKTCMFKNIPYIFTVGTRYPKKGISE